MRIPFRISFAILVLVTCIGYLISRLVAFNRIFSGHSGIPLRQQEIADAYDGTNDTRTQYIPKIVHQVYHNWLEKPGNDITSNYAAVQKRCKKYNPDFEFKMWDEGASRWLIETEYPWFLRTYDGYRYSIQRVDAIRYFLLLHYGGIFLDIDNGCTTDLTPTLYYPMWVTDLETGALSNNVLGARPNHPFWIYLTQSLMRYNWNWIFPHVTISYASGMWFETAVWEEYHAMLPKPDKDSPHEHRLHRLIMDSRGGADPWIYFTSERSATYLEWDDKVALFIGAHPFWFFGALPAGIALVIWLGFRFYRRRGRGYARLWNRSPGSTI